MKYIEFRCSDPTPKRFFKDFLDNFSDEIKKVCVSKGIEFNGNLLQQIILETYRMIKFERVRVEKLTIPLEIIRVELKVLERQRIQFLIRSLNSRGKPIFEDDIDCIRQVFPSNRLEIN